MTLQSFIDLAVPPKVYVIAAPALNKQLRQEQAKRKELINNPYTFNGICSIATQWGRESISLYHVDFARLITHQERLVVSVRCHILNEQGHMLWTQRGHFVSIHPDCWELGCSGVLGKEALAEAVHKELKEELGLTNCDIHVLGISAHQKYLQIHWVTQTQTSLPVPQHPEVADLLWRPLGSKPPNPQTLLSRRAIDQYQLWINRFLNKNKRTT
jgi:8-oxo-dGTP pyrophosphatase MutT (NUDIX family)